MLWALLLQETTEQPNTMPIRIGALIGIIIIVAIIFMRRKKKKTKVEDEF